MTPIDRHKDRIEGRGDVVKIGEDLDALLACGRTTNAKVAIGSSFPTTYFWGAYLNYFGVQSTSKKSMAY